MRILLAACFVAVFGLPAVAQDRVIPLKVMVPRQSNVTAALFDRYARDATDVARRVDGQGDTACAGLTLARNGAVQVEQTLPKRIDRQSQIERIRQLNTDVFVVDQLSICGGVVNDLIAGCELSSGPTILEADPAAYLTLIHEIGHAVGKSHRPQCPSQVGTADYKNIMHCKRHAERRWMTASDCSAMKQTNQFPQGVPMSAAPALPTAVAVPLGAVEQFLLLELPELSVSEAISALTPERLQAIRALLQGEDAEYWAPAAHALALGGDPSDLDLIIALASRAAGLDTPAGFRARTMVPQAIGLYAARVGDLPASARAVLLRGVDLQVAAALGLDGEAPLLSRSYALGAGLTGDPVLASAAIAVAAAAPELSPDAVEERGPDLGVDVARRALSVTRGNAAQAFDGAQVVAVGDPVAALEQLVETEQVEPGLVDILRGLGVDEAPVITRFNGQVFGAQPVDLGRLDQYLDEQRAEQ